MVALYWWCHTWGCPDYGHARALPEDGKCAYCRATLRASRPTENPMASPVCPEPYDDEAA